MRKRRYIRTYTGVLLTAGLLSFTWTDGFTVTHEDVVLIDPKGLFFVLLFSIIYSFMVDQDRSIHARSIGLGAIYGGLLGFLIGLNLSSTSFLYAFLNQVRLPLTCFCGHQVIVYNWRRAGCQAGA